jgi:serine/threonine protein kinase
MEEPMIDGFLDSDVILKDRYAVIEPIKAGAMGGIYLARDLFLNNLVAVKELYLHSTSDSHDHIINSFKREFDILSNLDHPNLPRGIDYFNYGEGFYIVMDYIEGNDLETIIEETFGQGIQEQKVLDWSLSICSILDYLHNLSPPVIYGDLKPSNIVLHDSDGKIFLVDFGLAKILYENEEDRPAVGTAGYAPPEQYRGEHDTRSDIYSLGVTIYHLLTAMAPAVPFEFVPPKNLNPWVSAEIDFVLSRALKIDPDARYQTIAEFRDDLATIYSKYYGHHVTQIFSRDDEKKKIKIFLVDDDQVMRLLFQSIIKRTSDMEVIAEAVNGKNAIETFKTLPVLPDVILMDINMPGIDGIETTKAIMEYNQNARVIMLTALSETKVIRKAFMAGAKGYMLKGGSINSVTEAIRKAFRGGLPIDMRISTIIQKEKEKGIKDSFKKPAFVDGSVMKLSRFSFINLLVHFSSIMASGKMILKNEYEEGEIYFEKGNIVHSLLGKLKGEKASYSFLSWHEGEASFIPSIITCEYTINMDVQKFITRALRKNRELAKIKLSIPSPYETPFLNSSEEYQIVSLNQEEIELLNFIDGRKNIMEISQIIDKSYFDVIKSIYRMMSIGLIRKY